MEGTGHRGYMRARVGLFARSITIVLLSSEHASAVAMLPSLTPATQAVGTVSATSFLQSAPQRVQRVVPGRPVKVAPRWSDLTPQQVTLAGGGTNVLLAGLKASVGLSARAHTH